MKTIKTQAIISGVRSKVDGSLSLNVHTPELSSQEKAEFMELQGKDTTMLIQPKDDAPEVVMEVEKGMDTKTPSQRIRSILFILWKQAEEYRKQQGEIVSFDNYYREKMEQIISQLKDKIEEKYE